MTYVTDCSLHTYTCGPFPDLFIKLRSSERSEFPEFLWEQPHQSRCSWENIWTLEIPFKKYLKIRLWTIFPATCGKHICCVSLCLTRKWNFWGEESLSWDTCTQEFSWVWENHANCTQRDPAWVQTLWLWDHSANTLAWITQSAQSLLPSGSPRSCCRPRWGPNSSFGG